MAAVTPLLVEMGINASLVAGAVIAARITLFVHTFIKRVI